VVGFVVHQQKQHFDKNKLGAHSVHKGSSLKISRLLIEESFFINFMNHFRTLKVMEQLILEIISGT